MKKFLLTWFNNFLPIIVTIIASSVFWSAPFLVIYLLGAYTTTKFVILLVFMAFWVAVWASGLYTWMTYE